VDACRLCSPRSAFEIVSLETPARLASSEMVSPASARALLSAFSVALLCHCLTLQSIFTFIPHRVKRQDIAGLQHAGTRYRGYEPSTSSAGSTPRACASFISVVMRGSISSRSILATVAVATLAR
jgi:hypothetical protein